MQPNQLAFFAKFIESELGIVYAESNYYQLQNRLTEIARALQMPDGEALYREAQVKMSPHMRQMLLDISTNNETSFFRDPKVFKSIEAYMTPIMADVSKGARAPLKIWSAACSSGQEPFTLSLLFRELSRMANLNCHVEITATDIATHILERAGKARFSQLEVQRGLPAAMMVRYFEKDAENYWTAKTELRSMIKFQRLNLLDSFSLMPKFDVILCRNVLIYQNPENKKKVIAKLAQQLTPDGILVMGAGESMLGLSEAFDTVRGEDSLFYKLKSAGVKAA